VGTLIVDAAAANASISTGGENDWYKFQTSTAGTYTIQTYGSLDTYMYFYQSDLTTLIAENDDGAGIGYNSKISQNLSANTWYYVKLRAYSATATGSYSIDVKSSVTVGTLIVDAAAANASISTGGENDWYKFQTSTAGTYTIQTYGSLDTYLYLYQSDLTTLIAENDDGAGIGYNSKISQNLSANTWYYVMIKLYRTTATGNYSIDVKSSVTMGTLIVDAAATNASISTGGENDWYQFQTGTAGTYSIQTYGSLDTYMYLYQSDQTSLIAENDDGAGSGYNSKIAQNLSANTWYYVKLRAYSATATGSYFIDVKSSVTMGTLIVDAAATNASISTGGENDWYQFQTGTAGTYTIQTYGNLDTYMYLYQSDQTSLIAEDDDGAGSGYNSKIAQNLSANTWYYVMIKLYRTTATGNYSIGVSENKSTKSSGAEAYAKGSTELSPDATDSAWISIYPNPATDKITIDLQGDFINLLRLEIVSFSGRKIFNMKLPSDQKIYEIINIQDFPAGLYFVRIVTSDRIITNKFIKR
jgi:hypothetical protein